MATAEYLVQALVSLAVPWQQLLVETFRTVLEVYSKTLFGYFPGQDNCELLEAVVHEEYLARLRHAFAHRVPVVHDNAGVWPLVTRGCLCRL